VRHPSLAFPGKGGGNPPASGIRLRSVGRHAPPKAANRLHRLPFPQPNSAPV